jgi:CBS domain-containing protein
VLTAGGKEPHERPRARAHVRQQLRALGVERPRPVDAGANHVPRSGQEFPVHRPSLSRAVDEALLKLQEHEAVQEKLDEMAVQDIAEAISGLDPEERIAAFRILPRERRADAFSYLSLGLQGELLDALSTDEARSILHELVPDDRTAFLESLTPEELEGHLKLLGPDDLKQSLKLLGYPDESAGRLMTPRYISVRPQWTVARALDHIRREAHRGETTSFIFVTDDRGRLLDAVRLKDFILAHQDAKVESMMDDEVTSVQAGADREEAVQIIQHYDINTLPVTDKQGVLLGIITVDDIMDVAEQETTEDFHKLGAASSRSAAAWTEITSSSINVSTFSSWRARMKSFNRMASSRCPRSPIRSPSTWTSLRRRWPRPCGSGDSATFPSSSRASSFAFASVAVIFRSIRSV